MGNLALASMFVFYAAEGSAFISHKPNSAACTGFSFCLFITRPSPSGLLL